MGGVALLVDAVTVEFGSFRAIDTLSLAIDFGEVRAVIGPNGAGKTTLLDVVSGITRPKHGRVDFRRFHRYRARQRVADCPRRHPAGNSRSQAFSRA